MSKIQARDARVAIGGRHVSCRSSNAVLTTSLEMPDITTFCSAGRERLHEGLYDIELTLDGFYDAAASSVDELYSTILGASALMTFMPGGFGTSGVGRAFPGIVSNYEMPFVAENAAAVNVTIAGSGQLFSVTSISGSALDVQRVPTVSGVGTSIIGSVDVVGAACPARSTYGTFQLFSLSGTNPEWSGSLQYSVDDSSWITLLAVEGASSDSVGAASASIKSDSSASRYYRLSVALAGTSPCASFLVTTGSFLGNTQGDVFVLAETTAPLDTEVGVDIGTER